MFQWLFSSVLSKLDQLRVLVDFLLIEQKSSNERERLMAKTLDDVLAKVRASNDKGDSLILLVKGLSAQLREALAENNQAKLLEILDEIDNQAGEFQAAIDENTPDEETTTEEEVDAAPGQ